MTEAWDQKWPNYCRTCGGWGFITWEENQSPLGSGHRWMETFMEPCEKCLMEDRCPRCGHSIQVPDAGPVICSTCRWDSHHPDGLQPEEPNYD